MNSGIWDLLHLMYLGRRKKHPKDMNGTHLDIFRWNETLNMTGG